MTTIKLKNFEFAGFTGGEPAKTGQYIQDAFDTPNGYVFIVAGAGYVSDLKEQPAVIIAERLKYYLENEVAADPKEAVYNALVYVNGFLYSSTRKLNYTPEACSCMCVLVREQKVYYSWIGDTFLYFFTGKKLVALSTELFFTPEGSAQKEKRYLGTQQFISPGTVEEALVPVDGDQLLMGCAVPGLSLQEKAVKKILTDSMPTHTKMLRLVKGTDAPSDGIALQLLLFYNLQHESRSFVLPGQETKSSKDTRSEVIALTRPWWQMLLALIAIILLSYMVYDLFLYNPRPGQSLPSFKEQADPEVSPDTMPEPDEVQDADIIIPDDIPYSVRSGDTWGRIYSEFEVCSWFIRNHEPNQGKFDRSGNPIAGSRLMIPVIYSARRSLNPDFYKEFTLDKVGSSCENAGQDFLDQLNIDNPAAE